MSSPGARVPRTALGGDGGAVGVYFFFLEPLLLEREEEELDFLEPPLELLDLELEELDDLDRVLLLLLELRLVEVLDRGRVVVLPEEVDDRVPLEVDERELPE